ncbi:translation initiation factor IF-2 N-terminal domain-containing protein [Nakamurella alba]|uniref:translation initiation factor IF-2 N-terminal domain-containing protein n=1 Tax=Nakamurella alba TaxID=2665158 RepID=UPI0018A8FF58|nr:translation initiation factor IF-2 N-terminal domain-containing protein [Nakamurella alba]
MSRSRIRVHELAGELGLAPDAVLEFLSGIGVRVRGRSAVLGESMAAQVRRGLREHHEPEHRPDLPVTQAVTAPRTTPATADPDVLFLAPVSPAPSVRTPAAATPPTAAPQAAAPQAATSPTLHAADGTPHTRPIPAVRPATLPPANRPGGSRPEHQPERPARNRPVPRIPSPRTSPENDRATAPEVDHDPQWRRRGLTQDQQAEWLAAGLLPSEAGLADQCTVADIEPDDLRIVLSGRSALQRLRGGESATSVWARIQEGEQYRRRGVRLSGRFQLG